MSSEKSSVRWTKFIPLGSRIASVVKCGIKSSAKRMQSTRQHEQRKVKRRMDKVHPAWVANSECCQCRTCRMGHKEILKARGINEKELLLLRDLII